MPQKAKKEEWRGFSLAEIKANNKAMWTIYGLHKSEVSKLFV